MDEFLKTWYGLYPHWIDDHTFEHQLNTYCICPCYMDKKQLYHWMEINQQMLSTLGCGGYQPVPNLKGDLFTDGKVVFMLTTDHFGLEELWKQNSIVCGADKSLLTLREKWIEKIEFVSQRYLFEVDNHHENYPVRMALIQYQVGLAKTAVMVLNDLIYDYPTPLPLIQLCHRRIQQLDGRCCMNPMNFVVDHPARDLCELYMRRIISFETLIECFEKFQYSTQELHYFFSRMLFPSWFFDVIESHYFDPEPGDLNDQAFMNQYYYYNKARKDVYHYLSQRINLKPLEW